MEKPITKLISRKQHFRLLINLIEDEKYIDILINYFYSSCGYKK
jgi:hypothetical protein